jgi:hypothetical protein
VVDQVEAWKDAIAALGEAAKFVPQAAFSGMQRSLQQEWTYVMRVVPLIGELFHPVEHALHHNFFTPLLGSGISDTLRAWTTAPMKLGGFSVPNPLLAADVNYRASQCETAHLISALRGHVRFNHVHHKQVMNTCREAMKEEKMAAASSLLWEIGRKDDGPSHKKVAYNGERGCSTWLQAIPSYDCNTVLSPVEFRDASRLRLDLDLLNTPTHCDGCDCKWSTSHALSCPFGGLIISRHNEARDDIMETAMTTYTPSNVRDEPNINIVRALVTEDGKAVKAVSVVEKLTRNQRKKRRRREVEKETKARAAREAQGVFEEEEAEASPPPEAERRKHALDGDGEEKVEAVVSPSDDQKRADLLVRGVWSPRTDCLVDFVVTDVNQPSYRQCTPAGVLRKHEQRKKKKYLADCQAQRRDFTPFVVSCEGMLGREADCFLKRIAMKLATKWSSPYSQVVGFIKTRFAISLVRATSRCLRGSRIKPEAMSFRVSFDDGAGLGLYSTLE